MRLVLATQTVLASASARTITGVATVYGERASASTGGVVFEPGSLVWASDLTRVKLLIDHDQRQPVGYATDLTVDGDELRSTFYVPPGDAGDEALTQAANGLRDGFSVGVWAEDDGYTFDTQGYMHITSGVVREVTLCALPAFDDARVSDVAAALATHNRTTQGDPMQCTTCGQTHDASVACTSAPAPQAAQPAPVAATPETVPTSASSLVVAASAITPPTLTQPRTAMSLRAACALISDTFRRGGSAADVKAAIGVQAALADVVPANDAGMAFLRETFLGELWRASVTRRPFTDALGTPKPLTGIKVWGWQWDVMPVVVDYAGGKAPVVGNNVSTKLVDATPERVAGGWDVDRIYVDLGEPGMIEALFEMATEDYRRKSETKNVVKLLAAASTVVGVETLAQALVAMGRAGAVLGANIGAVGFGADVWGGLTELTAQEVPWWFGQGATINIGTTEGNIGGVRIFNSADLAATQVMGVDQRAATFYEVDPPVRVSALDIANGGVDLGVFGYQALIINDSRAVIKTTVTPPVIP